MGGRGRDERGDLKFQEKTDKRGYHAGVKNESPFEFAALDFKSFWLRFLFPERFMLSKKTGDGDEEKTRFN